MSHKSTGGFWFYDLGSSYWVQRYSRGCVWSHWNNRVYILCTFEEIQNWKMDKIVFRSDGFSLKWDLHPYFSIYALLSSNHKSRSTLSQQLLTKFSQIVFWIIKMADFKYHTVMMSRSANIMIWKSKIHNSVFSNECCDTAIFLKTGHFSPVTFFSKIDFVLKN